MRTCLIWAFVTTWATASVAAAQERLVGPLPVLVDGIPLDVNHSGHAAPFFGDFDGDGYHDLLVGELYQGRLRIYLNSGSNHDPELTDFSLFKQGGPEGCVRSSGAMGFGPQLVDFDGDDDTDLLTSDGLGHVILFERLADDAFADARPINLPNGRPLAVSNFCHVYATDWDDDGDVDLLAGNRKNHRQLVLLINEGTRDSYSYADPETIEVSGDPINVPGGLAGPVAADWDADGLRDLVVGCGDGSIQWYRNGGETGRPSLEASQQLVPPANGDRGTAAKICVTDWNGDGVMDLLVGDCGESFDKRLSDEELRKSAWAHGRQETVLKIWASVFRRYRTLLSQRSETGDDVAAEIAAARDELVRLNRYRSQLNRIAQDLQPGKQMHGRVWLYESRPSQ